MTLKLLTLNTGLFELKFFGITSLKPANFIQERLQALPVEIEKLDADIIAFQEVFQEKHQLFIIEQLSNVYPYSAFHRNNSIKVNNGLMILSKFPIENIEYQPFNERGPIDESLVANKGILSCNVSIPNHGKLNIVNVHPTSGGFLNKANSPKIDAMRERQIHQAYTIAEKNNSPSIILGDFNAGPEVSPENYNYLVDKGYIDTYLHFCNRESINPKITWDPQISLNKKGTHSTSVSQRIDHVYAHPKIVNDFNVKSVDVVFARPVVQINSQNRTVHLSDHYGLCVELEPKRETLKL